jgi:bacterioferritin (cytochrome b1)
MIVCQCNSLRDDKLAERVIQLDGHPNFQTLDPLQIGPSLKEVLKNDIKGELSARKLTRKAARSATRRKTMSA